MKKIDLIQGRQEETAPGIEAYHVENDNAVCLDIYHTFLEAFQECEKLCPPYLNLVAVFFHHLMRLITGCVLKSFELKQFDVLATGSESPRPLQEFPGIGYHELLTGLVDVEAMNPLPIPALSLSRKKRWVNVFSLLLKRRKKIALLGVDNNVRRILKGLYSRGLNPSFATETKVHLPKCEAQMEVLRRVFQKVILAYRVPVDPSELMRLFVKWASPFLAKQPVSYDFDLLLTGSLQNLATRVVAAGARAAGKPVVTISHGDGDLLMVDEPRTGYGELTFATVYIGYGKQGETCMKKSTYLKSLYEQPRFVDANSNSCQKLYEPGKTITPLKDIKNATFMYVPTNFIREKRYGPFHNLPDPVYYQWQKVIYELFPDAIYKKHPKGAPFLPLPSGRIETAQLTDCVDKADVFVFDFISTAFNLAAATAKPIIYFDIGGRNPHPDALHCLRERTLWIDARQDKSLPSLEQELKKQEEKRLTNSYTERFCITDSGKKREESIVETVLGTL